MGKKAKIFVVTMLIVMLVLVCCCFAGFFAVVLTGLEDSSSTLREGQKDQTVAVIDVDTVITRTSPSDFFGNTSVDMTTLTVQKLRKAKDDENVKAVMLRVNTPGGEVYATKLIYNAIKDVQESGKPVVVLMQDTAASGGYYIAAPADWIVASEMTLTGSIGVKFSVLDTSGLYDKIGLKVIEITNSEGDLKVSSPQDLQNPDSDAYKVMQSVVDDYYNNFVDVVSSGRKMSREKTVGLADGRIYSGAQAKENGLVDELGEFDAAADKVTELADLTEPRFVLYRNDASSMRGYGLAAFQMFMPAQAALQDLDTKTQIKASYILSL